MKIREVYGERVHIFENCIPLSVRAAETAAEGKSIYLHDPKGAVAEGYLSLTEEVLTLTGCEDKPIESEGVEASGQQKGGVQ